MSFGKSINRALGNAARQSVIAQQRRKFKENQKAVKELSDAKNADSLVEERTIDVLRKHDQRYEAGNESISDEAYDKLKEDIRAKFPSNPYFKTNTTPNPEAVKEPALPVAMPGLTKVRPDSALAWVTSLGSKVDIVQDAEKIDGIACMLKYRDGVLVSAQKKGDEGHGKDIMPFVKYVASVPKKLTWKYIEKLSMPITMRGDLVIRGELACSFEAWEPYAKSGKNPHGFAHPRVMAAGIFRRDTVDAVTVKQLKAVDFIACTVAWPAQATPVRSRLILQNLFPIVAYGKQLSLAEMMTPDELVNLIKDAKDYSPYPCDGIVLSASDGGEIHQVAVKLNTSDQTAVKTVVTSVEINMSVRNLLKPTIIIKPVMIDGIEVSRLTGNNMREMSTYKVGPGSVVYVCRAGDVIPHYLKSGAFKPTPSKSYKLISKCPDCGSKLNWTTTANGKEGADLKCFDVLCMESKRTSTFLERIGVKGIGEALIEDLSIDRTVADVLAMQPDEISKVIGDKTGKTVYVNLLDAMRKSLAHIMYASGIFTSGTHSLGAATLSNILSTLNSQGFTDTAISDHVMQRGIDNALLAVLPPTNTSYLFIDRLTEFRLFYCDISIWHKPPRKSDDMCGLVFCFSSFRDPNLVDKIRSKGGIYSDTLNKKTTHLVSLTEPHPTKAAKAKELGVKCIRAESLFEMLGDPEYDGEEFSDKPEKPRVSYSTGDVNAYVDKQTHLAKGRDATKNPALAQKVRTVRNPETPSLFRVNPKQGRRR